MKHWLIVSKEFDDQIILHSDWIRVFCLELLKQELARDGICTEKQGIERSFVLGFSKRNRKKLCFGNILRLFINFKAINISSRKFTSVEFLDFKILSQCRISRKVNVQIVRYFLWFYVLFWKKIFFFFALFWSVI